MFLSKTQRVQRAKRQSHPLKESMKMSGFSSKLFLTLLEISVLNSHYM